jgi:feruloyl esterase
MKRLSFAAVLAVAGAIFLSPSSPQAAAPSSCESLASLALPHTTITLAESVAAGAFVPPGGRGRGGPAGPAAGPFAAAPAFCRVTATLRPSSDSDIKIEVWMPASSWNGKFQAVGNGGWSGAIVYPAMATALRRGYATASTDTGHEGGSGEFALNHPEKLVDFGYRAVHEMTVQAKAIVKAFYDSAPRLSYWTGCSSGGKQGLKEAQRFPEDYDGIVAGAPANYWTHLLAGSLAPAHATLIDPARYIPREKYQVIHDAVIAMCDAGDRVRDGVLEDPRRCRFDPKVLLCKSGDGPSCLTAPQVEAARAIYASSKNPRTGRDIFPGLEPGSEKGWAALAGGPSPFAIPVDHFKYVVFKDPNWDFRTLDFDKDVALADKIDGGLLNAIDPNLEPFVSRGGKLIIWHGWNDQLIAPRNAINYYTSVVSALGGAAKTAASVRLFMAPGVNHCAGGDGPSSFDMLSALEEWVERGKAPDRIVAARLTNGVVDRTRPLCPYPQIAQYTGKGNTDVESNFVCRAPAGSGR